MKKVLPLFVVFLVLLPSLGIDWRLAPEDVILSPKDSAHPLLSEAGELFDYNKNYYSL